MGPQRGAEIGLRRATLADRGDEVGVGVAGRGIGLAGLVAAVGVLASDRAEPVALDPEGDVGAEHLHVPLAGAGGDVVPRRAEQHVGVVGGAQEHAGLVFDPVDAVVVGGESGHGGDPAHDPLDQVEVVDRVLEQRPRARQDGVAPPRGVVHAPGGKVLIVAKHHGHGVTGAGRRHLLFQPAEGG